MGSYSTIHFAAEQDIIKGTRKNINNTERGMNWAAHALIFPSGVRISSYSTARPGRVVPWTLAEAATTTTTCRAGRAMLADMLP